MKARSSAQKNHHHFNTYAHTQMIILLHLFTHSIQFAVRGFSVALCEFYSKLTNLFLLDFFSHVCVFALVFNWHSRINSRV